MATILDFPGFTRADLDEVTFHSPSVSRGSNQTKINVDLNGRPFAQLWTYTAKGESHPWHAKVTKTGRYRAFEGKRAKARAMDWIRGEVS
jgi:hypothetical protein